MNPLQLREKEIFKTLKVISKYGFAVIGGYAVNCYTLPRFSADCDIVIGDYEEAKKISKELERIGYTKMLIPLPAAPYQEDFMRYEKSIYENFRVSIDMLIGEVLDRQTNARFSAKWIFGYSKLRLLKGKTITEELRLRIINEDALFVMKFVSGRTVDIRDVFMLATRVENIEWVKQEISKRFNFEDRLIRVRQKITSPEFKNNLQGVYGRIDEKLFERHKKVFQYAFS